MAKLAYPEALRDIRKLYSDQEEQKRARAFLSGCLNAGIEYDQAKSLMLSAVPSDRQEIPLKAPKKPKQAQTSPQAVEIVQKDENTAEMAVQDEIRAYGEEITSITETYIDTVRGGDLKNPPSWFPDLMYYIVDRIKKPAHDITLLNGLWEVYKRICSRCGVVITLQHFGTLTSISPMTFDDWKRGDYRKSNPIYGLSVKKWVKECESALTAEVTQKDGANINKIFILKSCYGYTDQPMVRQAESLPAVGGAYPVLGLPVSDR